MTKVMMIECLGFDTRWCLCLCLCLCLCHEREEVEDEWLFGGLLGDGLGRGLLRHCRHSSTICCSSYTPANQQANLLYCQVLYSSPTIKPTRPLLLFSYIAICWTPTLPLESVIPKTTLLAGLQFYPYIHSDVGGRGQLIQDIYQSMTRNIF